MKTGTFFLDMIKMILKMRKKLKLNVFSINHLGTKAKLVN